MPVALGIDVEDIIHTPAYRSLSDSEKSGISADLPAILKRLLTLFDEHDVSVTFFIVGDLVKKYPDLIAKMAREGHEIASHSQTHCSMVDVNTDRVRDELRTSKRQLEAVTDTEVTGFRAPTCRINDDVYNGIAEGGYRYSSSVLPSIPIPGFYSRTYPFREPIHIVTKAGDLLELPLAVNPVFRLPISGAWIRLLGRRYLRWSVRELLARSLPVVTYSHPWEFTSMQGTALPPRCRIRTGEWLYRTYDRLLQTPTEFCTISEVAEQTTDPQVHDLSG